MALAPAPYSLAPGDGDIEGQDLVAIPGQGGLLEALHGRQRDIVEHLVIGGIDGHGDVLGLLRVEDSSGVRDQIVVLLELGRALMRLDIGVYTYISMNKTQPTTPSLSSFSSIISSGRRALELSTAELARRAALPVAFIQRLEQGKFIPSPSQAYHLGVALQMVEPAAFAEQATCLLLLYPHHLLEHFDAGAA